MTRPEVRWPRRVGPLELGPPTGPDIDQLLRWRTRPDVNRWLLRTEIDPEAFRTAWLDSVENPRDHSVVARRDGAVVGTVSLEIGDGMGQSEQPDRWRGTEGLLGYLVDPAHSGRGYATAMAKSLLGLAFDELGLRRVTAGCFADNIASWRVMERIGMRREQHGVKDSWHAELGWIDGYTYAILAGEWSGHPSG